MKENTQCKINTRNELQYFQCFLFFSSHLFLAAITIFITRHSSLCCCRFFYVSNRECVPHKRFENLLTVYTRRMRLCTFRFSSFGMQRACRRIAKMFTIIHRKQEKKAVHTHTDTHARIFNENNNGKKILIEKEKKEFERRERTELAFFFFSFLVR